MKKQKFFEINTKEEIEYYVKLINMMGSLSKLFSENTSPYLDSRVSENIFCRCLNAENLSRSDVTADAKKDNIGIGIKTWIGSNLQKIAEFNKNKNEYDNIKDIEGKINKIAQIRNERIDFTKRTYNLKSLIYHCSIRDYQKVILFEGPLEKININKIKIDKIIKNVIKFHDDYSKYSFNLSKSTLYKDFNDLVLLKEIPINIIEDPYDVLEKLLLNKETNFYEKKVFEDRIYLPLYSYTKKNGKKVEEKSGLNQRFAGGRKRNEYEVYIPIPKKFREKHKDFFPPKEESFELILPNDKLITVKVCQEDGKALMSNPNEALGHWLIDDVLKIKPQEIITYEMLQKYDIDSVEISKYYDVEKSKFIYKINFAKTGSYDLFMKDNIDEEIEENL